jgi:hypothetical protein
MLFSKNLKGTSGIFYDHISDSHYYFNNAFGWMHDLHQEENNNELSGRAVDPPERSVFFGFFLYIVSIEGEF